MVDDETRWNILARHIHGAERSAAGWEWGHFVEGRMVRWLPVSAPWYASGWYFAVTLLSWGERHEDMRP